MAGNQGKYAEDAVRKWLKAKEEAELHFTFNRIMDAKSAMGRFGSQPGDFQAFAPKRNWLIEIKSSEHAYRIPHGSFGIDQVGRMVKRQLAGTECFVLFYSKTTKLWRTMDLEFFRQREGGSWDLRPYQEVKLQEALTEVFA